MQVIFIKNLKGVGKQHDVKNVADGYALNFLIPKGYAIIANEQSLQKIKQQQDQELQTKQQQDQELEQLLNTLKQTKSVTLAGNTHNKGHLYKAINPQEIINHIHKQHRVFIPKHLLELKNPIKELGDHTITVGTKEKNISYTVHVAE
jgi:large subunit ribosomal protein L9